MQLDILPWLAGLQVRTGRLSWRLQDIGGRGADLELEVGQDATSLIVSTAGGRLLVRGAEASWVPAAGPVVRARLPDSSLLDSLRQGVVLDPTPALGPLAAASAKAFGSELAWLQSFQPNLTVLVIPGVSAFGVKLPPVQIGGVSLPELRADVSLRNLAVDLSVGAIAFELRIHDAKASGGGKLRIVADGQSFAVLEPELKLAADLFWSLHDQRGGATIDWLWAVGKSVTAELASAASQSASISGGASSCQVRGLVYDVAPSSTRVRGGDAKLQCKSVEAKLKGVAVGPLAADEIRATATECEIGLALNDQGVRPTISLAEASMVTTNARLTGLPTTTPVQLDPATPVTAEVRGLALTLPQTANAFQRGVVDVDATILPVIINLSGLVIDVTSKINMRVEAAVNGQDLRTGALFKFASAKIKFPGLEEPITLSDASAEHTEFLPSGLLNPPKTVLRNQSIDQISLRVKLPAWKVVDKQVIEISPSYNPVLEALLQLLLKHVSGAGVLQDALNFLARMGDINQLLPYLQGLGGIFGIRIEDVRFLLGLDEVKIKVDHGLSGDRTLALRLEWGFTGVGVGVRYSWPAPTWDDWGNRDDDRIAPWFGFGGSMPDLVLKIQFSYDAPAKRIRFTGLKPYFDIPGVDPEVEEGIQGLIMAYYGVSNVIDGIVKALNASVPTGLPDAWEVSELQLTRANNSVDGFGISLRAHAAKFDQI